MLTFNNKNVSLHNFWISRRLTGIMSGMGHVDICQGKGAVNIALQAGPHHLRHLSTISFPLNIWRRTSGNIAFEDDRLALNYKGILCLQRFIQRDHCNVCDKLKESKKCGKIASFLSIF